MNTKFDFAPWLILTLGLLVAACSPGTGGGNPTPLTPYSIAGNVSVAPASTTPATIEWSGAASGSVVVDAAGNYTLPNLANGSYTLTPKLTGYTFAPLSTLVAVNGANVAGTNFSGAASAAPTYTLSGAVTGDVMAGVTITLAGAAAATTVTDAAGFYTFTGLIDGNYVLTPSLAGYTFTSATLPVVVAGAALANQDFVSAANLYNISGVVSGAAVANVTITLYGGVAPVTATTDVNGYYSFTGIVNGNYTATPNLTGYIFTPATAAVTVAGANANAVNFTSATPPAPPAATYSLSGTVSGVVVSGVTMTLYGGVAPVTALTDVNGYYSFAGLANGSYTLTPSLAGYTFSPTTKTITIGNANSIANDFTSAAAPVAGATYSISGTISGATASGVTVTLYGGATPVTAATDANGYYQFNAIANGSYTMTPSLVGYTFSPTSTVITINGASQTGKNFTSAIAPVAGTTYGISGVVDGVQFAGVKISLYNGAAAPLASAITDAVGYYSFTGLANGDYTLIPSYVTCTPAVGLSCLFSPTSAVVTISGANVTGTNFTSN